MKIVHIASECAPIAKAGGLGDVVHGLACELQAQKHQVVIFLPHYQFLQKKSENFSSDQKTFELEANGVSFKGYATQIKAVGCKIILLDVDHPKNYLFREKIYGYPDDVARFLIFTKAALQYLTNEEESIDVLHCHDWHTAAAPLIHKSLFHNKGLCIHKHIFTIHNLKYQGICEAQELNNIGLNTNKNLDPEVFNFPKPQINLLKAGILYADVVTTVSPTYAQEILQPEHSFGLDAFLRTYRGKVKGILNGIDTTTWSPSTDLLIPHPYSRLDTIQEINVSKNANRQFLAKKMRLASSKTPLFACISRLVPQKGPKLIEAAIVYAAKNNAQFILLGSSPIPEIQHHFLQLKKAFNTNSNIHFVFEYDDPLSHLIFASADFLVMPSIFEPCGLSQLIAMSYGTIPIVRSTGGIIDTVFDIDKYPADGNGFCFTKPIISELYETMDRAINCFMDPKRMHLLRKRVMQLDHSWQKPCKQYLEIYSK